MFDQLIKLLIRSSMYIGESIPIIKDLFHITYVQNRGGAFSLFSDYGVMLIIIPIVAIILGIWYMKKHQHCHWTLTCSLCLIISGGVGNLIDRMAFGFVTDMFDFRFFPVFNIADMAVCIGAGLMILYMFAFADKDELATPEP